MPFDYQGKVNKSLVREQERGEGRLKFFVYLIVLICLVVTGWKCVPPYVAEYQLSDKMQEQARYAVVNHYSEEQIRDTIFKVIQDLDIPAKKEAIKVSSTQSLVTISVDYSVPIDLYVYKFDMHFNPASANKSLV